MSRRELVLCGLLLVALGAALIALRMTEAQELEEEEADA